MVHGAFFDEYMMSVKGLEEPPAKKRRFSRDDPKDEGDPTPFCLQKASHLADQAVDDAANQAPAANPPSEPPSEHPPSVTTSTTATHDLAAFDVNAFQSFVGGTVDAEALRIIGSKCGNNLERAVNMYFDGTWKNYRRRTPFKNAASLFALRTSPAVPTDHVDEPDPLPVRPDRSQSMPTSRYIGAFGVEGWVTRSGNNLVKHGDTVKIERQKIQPPTSSLKTKGKAGPASAPRGNSAAARRVDVIVRFTDARGTEIGRLAKDTANWVSSLMDQKVCRFEGSCVYAPERLRTNDTVFLQLRCFLLRTAFQNTGAGLSDNRSTGFFEEKETAEERGLRLRQVALVRLFQEINLTPARKNAAAARNARQGLLDAAEMAEKKNKDVKSSNRETPGSSPPPDDAEDGQELEQDQLDALYRKAQSFDFNTPEAEPAETFNMDLRPYQKQSLYWMMAKEKDHRSGDREASIHPLWEEYIWPTKDVDDQDIPPVDGQASFYVNPYSGEMSLDFPVQEQHCLGGILADEMGLGKTIQMLSLIHSHKFELATERTHPSLGSVNDLLRLSSSGSSGIVSAHKTSLVIAPMSLLAQWQSEAENASKEGTLRSIVYYGNEKADNLQMLCCDANFTSAPDVVITSYGVVLSEFTQIASKNGNKDSHRGLFSLDFFRIILDEAHTIKNRQSKTAKACYELSAKHRWVLTGTPIVNRLEDLFSLVRFLRVEPWNNFSFWRTFITVPFESKDFMRALDVVQTVLEPLVMRRTKDMKTPDGQALVALPPKSIEIVEVELSRAERDVYDHIFTRAKRTLSSNVERGTVMKAFTTIFAQILRLRQSCCHPILVRNQEVVTDEEIAGAEADAAAGLGDDMDLQSLIERFTATTDDGRDANAFGAHILAQIRDEAVNECPICTEEPMIDQTVTSCWHSACKKCLLDYIKHRTDRHQIPRCVNCREPINARDLFEVVRHDDEPDDALHAAPRISLQRLGVNESSAKVVALMKRLRELRREHPRMKSVVFSQFTSFMSLIEPALTKANMRYLRLDGSSNQKARAAILSEFRGSSKFTILLISLRAGGVGLNLTQAKRVFMMDPWWSFAVEAQAIDRVHRMGQEDVVKVYRFITKNSVEERMLKVQDRKKFIATSLGMMTDEEKRLQRIEDIKELLS
ncbi:DNA repair protein rad-5 [Durotheca rogersii]|uniref:DNA repair protein rad-5 n=1 Tax=Durotheca rogersii TaxID=419775 RepID=UPI00221F785C|nr:DNA repair protein rad-5 [Durotheca rogersii]KAI5867929.1 DNA repair protein rad-5 [Durotheca rogersii]